MGLVRPRVIARFMMGFAGLAAMPVRASAASLSTPVAVVGIESDDAENLAESLTESLERAVDKAPGWRKVHVRESLSTLSFAFKCPARPDAACLERIAQHLGVDVVVWGTMHKAAEARFDASVHLWRRRGPGSEYAVRMASAKDPRADGTVDAQGAACAKNLLAPIRSVLVVKALGDPQAMLRVDGLNRVPFSSDGVARLELEAGPHRVELARGLVFSAGREVDLRGDEEVSITLDAGASAAKSDPLPLAPLAEFPLENANWKSYAGFGALGVGGVLGVAAVVEAVRFSGYRGDLEDTLARVPRTVTDVCATDTVPNAVNACRSYQDAQSARTLGFVFGAVSVIAIGGGAALLWQATHEAAPAQSRVGFVPRNGGGEISFTTPMD